AFLRTAYYMPSLASSVVVTLIFLWASQRTGLFNYLLGLFRTYWPMLLAFLVLAALFQVLQVLWDRRRGHPARWLEPGAVLTSLLLAAAGVAALWATRSEEHTSELQSRENLVCR